MHYKQNPNAGGTPVGQAASGEGTLHPNSPHQYSAPSINDLAHCFIPFYTFYSGGQGSTWIHFLGALTQDCRIRLDKHFTWLVPWILLLKLTRSYFPCCNQQQGYEARILQCLHHGALFLNLQCQHLFRSNKIKACVHEKKKKMKHVFGENQLNMKHSNLKSNWKWFCKDRC